MTPIQPTDETPISESLLLPYGTRAESLLPSAQSIVASAAGSVDSAIRDELDQNYATIQTAINGVHSELSGEVASAAQLLAGVESNIDRQIVDLDNKLGVQLDKAEDRLIAAGIPYPVGHLTRTAELNSDGAPILIRIKGPVISGGYATEDDFPVTEVASTPLGGDECRLCYSYPGDPNIRTIGNYCTDSVTGEVGQWSGDPDRPGYVILQPIGRPCEPRVGSTPGSDYNYVGASCFDSTTGQWGFLYQDANNPNYLYCSSTPPGVPPAPPVPPTSPPTAPPPYSPPGAPLAPPTVPGVPPVAPGTPWSPPPAAGPAAPPTVPGTPWSPPPTPGVPPAGTPWSPPGSSPGVPDGCPTTTVTCPTPQIVVNVAPCAPGVAPAAPAAPGAPPAPPAPGGAPPVPTVPTAPPTAPGAPPAPPAPPTPPAPPAPPVPDVPHLPANQNSVNWESATICSQIAELCHRFQLPAARDPGRGSVGSSGSQSWWSQAVDATQLVFGSGAQIGQTLWNAVVGSDGAGSVGTGVFSGLWRFGSAMASDYLTRLAPAGVTNIGAASVFSAKIGVAGFVSKWAGIPLDWYSMSDRYSMQYCDPQLLPSQGENDAMYLTSEVSDDQWLCLTRANGMLPGWAKGVRDSKQVKLNVNEQIQAYYRGIIRDKKALKERLRQVGVTNESYVDEWIELAKQIPGYADLLRMMVRDSADDNVALDYGYDEGFGDKFKGVIKEWSEQQGIDATVFKYIWRAHWTIPSNTQLYEMLHRLRGDRPEVVRWDSLYGNLPPGPLPPGVPKRPPVVTESDVKTALEVNDLAPAWVGRAMAISYHPITNTDARRMYQNGQVTKEQLVGMFQDNGYTEKDSQSLAQYESVLKDRTLATQSGVLSVRELSRFYEEGLLNRRDADRQLAFQVPDDGLRERLLDQIDERRKLKILQRRTAYLRKRYLQGVDDLTTTRAALAIAGMPAETVTDVLDQWTYDKMSRLREPRVAMLCTWYTKGYITGQEYLRRLQNLGYSEEDAYKIAGVCWSDEVKKRMDAARRAAEQRLKEIEKLEKQKKADYSREREQLAQQIRDYQEQLRNVRPPEIGSRP